MHTDLLKKKTVIGDGLRFIILGIANTVFTLLIFQLLVTILSPLYSYCIAYLCGLVVVLLAYPAYVFRGSCATPLRMLTVIGIYAGSVLLGGLLLEEVRQHDVNPRIGIFIAIAATTSFNFGASRAAFRLRHR
jgi:putative flippase GtrA